MSHLFVFSNSMVGKELEPELDPELEPVGFGPSTEQTLQLSLSFMINPS